ncbi:predicted protein [Uncinocarpus reesii 1704]|uniref:Uncharacterized protein n=1 Tax=Uncinocarpus reesii (strain UAMH 1704) TaxID=336963 RepID=C4JXU1_UNCRE|nr:uncharacterized protein UREG_07879 [Uncinocarpus reesii 1704]EEP83014.1 predicted protein [Uncinocarpus reesii 1704]
MARAFPRSATLLTQLASSTNQEKPDGSAQDYTDQGFAIIINAVEHQFKMQRDYMDGRFGEMDARLDGIDATVEQLRAMMANGKADRAVKILLPVGAYQTDGRYATPDNFPRTVADFWKLKNDPKAAQLVSLCQFYNVKREELIDPDVEDSSTEEGVPYASLSLKQLVRRFPIMAHMALADRIGLKYSKVSAFMQKLGTYMHTTTTKRPQPKETAEGAKKLARTESAAPAPTTPENPKPPSPQGAYQRFSKDEVVPLEYLVKTTPSTVESELPSNRTQLGWAETSVRRMVDERVEREREQLQREEAEAEAKAEAEAAAAPPRFPRVPAPPVSDSTTSPPRSGDTEPLSSPLRLLGQSQVPSRPKPSRTSDSGKRSARK